MSSYFIKEGYKTNKGTITYVCEDKKIAAIYQTAVYQFAQKIIRKHKLQSLLDIGCGNGDKLQRFIYPFCSDITGVDTKKIIEYCKKEYSFGKLFIDNVENSQVDFNRKFDIILASDIIEHLTDPDTLLQYIKKYAHDNTQIIISTPERDAIRDITTVGPPENPFHVREWNQKEFAAYLSSQGFIIHKHFLVHDFKKSILRQLITFLRFKKNRTCQIVLCTFSSL